MCGISIAVVYIKLYGYFCPYIKVDDDLLQELAQFQVFITLFISLLIRVGRYSSACYHSLLHCIVLSCPVLPSSLYCPALYSLLHYIVLPCTPFFLVLSCPVLACTLYYHVLYSVIRFTVRSIRISHFQLYALIPCRGIQRRKMVESSGHLLGCC